MKNTHDEMVQEYLAKGGKVTVGKTVYGSTKKPKARTSNMITSVSIGRHSVRG